MPEIVRQYNSPNFKIIFRLKPSRFSFLYARSLYTWQQQNEQPLLSNTHFQQRITDRPKHLKAFPLISALRFMFSKKLSSTYIIFLNSHLEKTNKHTNTPKQTQNTQKNPQPTKTPTKLKLKTVLQETRS